MASGSSKRFLDWEERFVSHDRGSRVVHYYLKDRHGHQCLAVIGTERSLRHMVYVVCDDFLPLAGLDKSTTSGFKWRARREVVDWLSSFLSKVRASDASHLAGSPRNALYSSTDADSALSYEGAEGIESGQEECRSRHQHDAGTRKHCSISKADVLWVGSSWSCRKRLRHFNSFQRNGITISVHDFVYVMTEEKDRHIAYVEDLFEDKKLRKKLRVRWFHRTSELTCRIPPPVPHPREVFFTAFHQDLSVECVDGVATVLTPEHHEVCLASLPADTVSQALICSRQFDSEGIRPFNIQDVKGYWQQTVLSLAGLVVPQENSPQSCQGSEDLDLEEEGVDRGRIIRRGPRTARCSRRRAGLGTRNIRSPGDASGDTTCMSGEPGGSGLGDGKYAQSNKRRSEGGIHEQDSWRFDVGDHIEILSEDSGLRGCWFKGTVLRKDFRRLQVRYDDVLCEDGKGNLEEWVPNCKIAGACKLGIRISGRPCIRPSAPEGPGNLGLNLGDVVDVWWHDGWWEGILCGTASFGLIPVHIPGEQETATFRVTDLRSSKEWVHGAWAAIPSYPDIVMSLGLSIGNERVEQAPRQDCGSMSVEQVYLIKEDKCGSSTHKVLPSGAVDQKGADELNRSTKISCESVEEESLAIPFVGSASSESVEDLSTLLTRTAESSRTGDDYTMKAAVVNFVKQEHQDLGVTSESRQSRMMVPSLGLKWKAGRKRHRQGDLVTSKADRSVIPSVNEVKEESSLDSFREETSSDRNIGVAMLREEGESLSRWKTGDGEELIKSKKLRQGNENTLKSLHGAPLGSSFFTNSIPIANLVMSR